MLRVSHSTESSPLHRRRRKSSSLAALLHYCFQGGESCWERFVSSGPRFGERTAELLERPVMLIPMFLAARRIVRQTGADFRSVVAFAIGAVALSLLILPKLIVVLKLRGPSISDSFVPFLERESQSANNDGRWRRNASVAGSIPVLSFSRLRECWWTGSADHDDVQPHGRAAEMADGGSLREDHGLLSHVAWPRSTSISNLCRLFET